MNRFCELLVTFAKKQPGTYLKAKYSFVEQEQLSRTINTVLPLTTYIVTRFPVLKKLRFGIACTLLSIAPAVLYLVYNILRYRVWSNDDTIYTLFMVVLSLLGFLCVNINYERLRDNRANIVYMVATPQECLRLEHFFRLAFDIGNQLISALIFSGLSVAIALLLGLGFMSIKSVILILWWACTFGVLIGNGLYWAIFSPQLALIVSVSRELSYDRISPGETPGIRSISSMLGTHAIMEVLVVTTIFLAFSLIPFPGEEKSISHFLAFLHLAGGALMIIYASVYPQMILIRLVHRLKEAVEHDLLESQEEILTSGSGSPHHLQAIHTILSRLRKSKSSPIAVGVVIKYISSVAIPVIAIFAKKFNILSLISKLLKN